MEIKIFQIDKQDDGIRLDRWFFRNIPQMSFIIVAKLIRKGQVRLDGKRVKINTKINYSQMIRTPIIGWPYQHKKKYFKPKNFELFKENFFNSIIYEDQYLMALNKPYNLCVQGGSGVKISIVCILRILNLKYNIVHRIDKHTTGLLLIAKNILVTAELNKLFREKEIAKTYLAILSGIPTNRQGVIESTINNYTGCSQKKQVAKTRYEILSVYSNMLSLVKMIPITGKKHQLRIHSRELQCPVLGDNKYSKHQNQSHLSCIKNLHLHSYSLNFQLFNKNYAFRAPIPSHFKNTLRTYFLTYSENNL